MTDYELIALLRKEKVQADNRVAELEQRLGNLLARIHRDGGHYVAEHGWAKAEADADAKIVQWIARDND